MREGTTYKRKQYMAKAILEYLQGHPDAKDYSGGYRASGGF
jgi:hypothetical protein